MVFLRYLRQPISAICRIWFKPVLKPTSWHFICIYITDGTIPYLCRPLPIWNQTGKCRKLLFMSPTMGHKEKLIGDQFIPSQSFNLKAGHQIVEMRAKSVWWVKIRCFTPQFLPFKSMTKKHVNLSNFWDTLRLFFCAGSG